MLGDSISAQYRVHSSASDGVAAVVWRAPAGRLTDRQAHAWRPSIIRFCSRPALHDQRRPSIDCLQFQAQKEVPPRAVTASGSGRLARQDQHALPATRDKKCIVICPGYASPKSTAKQQPTQILDWCRPEGVCWGFTCPPWAFPISIAVGPSGHRQPSPQGTPLYNNWQTGRTLSPSPLVTAHSLSASSAPAHPAITRAKTA